MQSIQADEIPYEIREYLKNINSIKFQVKIVVEQKKDSRCWAHFEFLKGETIRIALKDEKNKGKRQKMHEMLIYHFFCILANYLIYIERLNILYNCTFSFSHIPTPPYNR
ncbi:hypothetical protein FJQ98_14385 [Lysinibacillus agricola]|uniref:Uncharacterized protein n=1 Tax=Lysinibacillus agricola TaxID=2590012 RepID=A0ABX7B0Q3_9BACI|nr:MULTISPECIES: hypothetical protein [Lysinibacillus]KOS64673.1 hypothetical protein AN161_01235 [Lysinibacillus sp. FJAT-14222]QQP15122.1 hypothetical protein FJQ98_14385 [Lysinibacillus agricola]